MNEVKRLASRLPVKRISRWEMFVAKLKMRYRESVWVIWWDLNYPVAYRYFRKFMRYVGVEL